MKKMVFLTILGTLMIFSSYGESTWRGQAKIITFPGVSDTALFAATNEFPRNTMLNIENPATKKTLQVRVVQRAPEITDGNFVYLSPQAGALLGMKTGESVLVVVQVDVSLDGLRASLIEDRTLSRDPERNPGALAAVPQTTNPPVLVETTTPVDVAVVPETASVSPSAAGRPPVSAVEVVSPTLTLTDKPQISPTTISPAVSSVTGNPEVPTLGSLTHEDLPGVAETGSSLTEAEFLAQRNGENLLNVGPQPARPLAEEIMPSLLTPSLPAGTPVAELLGVSGETARPLAPISGLALVTPTVPVSEETPWLSPSVSPSVGTSVAVLTPSLPMAIELPGVSPSVALGTEEPLGTLILPELPLLVDTPLTVSTPVVVANPPVTVVTPLFREPTTVEPLLTSPETSPVAVKPTNGNTVVVNPSMVTTPTVVTTTPPVDIAPVDTGVPPRGASTVALVAPQTLLTQPYSSKAISPMGGVLGDLKVISSLSSSGDYIQLASFGEERSLMKALEGIKSHVPLTIWATTGDRPVFRLVAGPLGRDQTGVLVYHFRNQGYKDAFVIKQKP